MKHGSEAETSKQLCASPRFATASGSMEAGRRAVIHPAPVAWTAALRGTWAEKAGCAAALL